MGSVKRADGPFRWPSQPEHPLRRVPHPQTQQALPLLSKKYTFPAPQGRRPPPPARSPPRLLPPHAASSGDSMTIACGFSRFLSTTRVHSSTNRVLSLWFASCPCSSASASACASEPPEIAGDPDTVREGRAEIFADKSNSVFFNKAQVSPPLLPVYVCCRFDFLLSSWCHCCFT